MLWPILRLLMFVVWKSRSEIKARLALATACLGVLFNRPVMLSFKVYRLSFVYFEERSCHTKLAILLRTTSPHQSPSLFLDVVSTLL